MFCGLLKTLIKCNLLIYVISQVLETEVIYDYGSLEIFLKTDIGLKVLELSMEIPFLWTSSVLSLSEKEKVEEHEKETVVIGNKETLAERFKAKMVFKGDQIVLQEFPFYYIESLRLSFFDSFPLTLNYKNSEMNPIDNLYNNNNIAKRQFSLLLKSNWGGLSGNLFLGGMTSNVTSTLPYTATIKVDEDKIKWTSKFTSVLVGDVMYNIQDEFVIISRKDTIYAPSYFIKILNETIFSNLKHACKYRISVLEKWERYYCDCDKINDVKIKFLIGDYAIELNKTILFDEWGGNYCFFNIEKNLESQSQWLFGISFLKAYPILFDLDEKSFTLFSDREFQKAEEIYDYVSRRKNFFFTKKLFVLIIFIELGGIFITLVNKKHYI